MSHIIDEMAAASHEVVQLPAAHYTLNRNELAWAQVKGHIKSNAHDFNLTKFECLVWKGFDVVTPVEDRYWQIDGLTIYYSACEFIIPEIN